MKFIDMYIPYGYEINNYYYVGNNLKCEILIILKVNKFFVYLEIECVIQSVKEL